MRSSSGLKLVFGVLPLAALVAVGFWLNFVVKYADEDAKGVDADLAYEYLAKAEICFQAVVATILVYFVSHHGLDQILHAMGRID